MKRYIRNLQIALAVVIVAVSLSGCTDEIINVPTQEIAPGSVSYNEDGTMNVDLYVDVPEMKRVNTRAMGDDPNYEELGLYMLVFEWGEGLTQFVKLSDKQTPGEDDLHSSNGLVKFRAQLEPTENNVVIHLIATDQPNFSQQIGSGMVESTVGTLYTKDGYQAYWQRIDLGVNIPSREQIDPDYKGNPEIHFDDTGEAQKKAEAIKEKLSHVPMVRNFAKVSVRLGDNFYAHQQEGDKDYEVTGLYVINTLDRGTVAPYRATYSAPDEENELEDGFVEFYYIDENTGEYKQNSYRKMTDNRADIDRRPPSSGADNIDRNSQNYIGNLASGVRVVNTDVKNEENIASKNLTDGDEGFPVYFYERPARENSNDRTYTVVKIKNENDKENIKEQFYKIDIGHVWDPYMAYPYMGIFEYYNLLRNFHYEIKINRIDGEGYSTLEEAANGPVFNNISASVEAKSMKAISDGDDWIYVSRTSYVFTETGQELELLAQFREKINDTSISDEDKIKNGLLQRPVISNPYIIFNEVNEFYTEGDPYKKYVIKCIGTPTSELQSQELYIYRGPKNWQQGMTQDNIEYGLYRIVTIFMHERWQFKHMDILPGLWEDPNDLPDFTWTKDKREVGQSVGAPLTLFFELPGDLPRAIFPLEFVIESERQNIQNAYVGNAVVQSVPASESLFKTGYTPSIGVPTTSRIQYVKTVTWEDYNGSWSEEYNPDGNKMVRCRFLTITDLAQDGIGTGDGNKGEESYTNIRVYNEYFGTKQVNNDKSVTWLPYQENGFYRDRDSSDPTPRIWDFCSSNWDSELVNKMNSSNRTQYRANNNKTADDNSTATEDDATQNVKYLILVEGRASSMSTGTDGGGYRYIRTSNANDRFRFTHSYPASHDREMRIDVICTTDEWNENNEENPTTPTPPKITVPSGFIVTTSAELIEGTPYKKYMYVYTVPESVEDVTIDVQPASETPMRFYKIEVYPRWDELKPKPQPQPEETDETTP